MYLRKGKTKNGKIHLSITQSYRNTKGKPTNKTIKTFGNLDVIAKEWNMTEKEALKKCEDICKEMTENYRIENTEEIIKLKPKQRVDKRKVNIKNLGCAVPLAYYNALGIEKIVRNKFVRKGSKYDANAILRLLVIERILNPRSRRQAHQNKDNYFFRSEFSETDMSRACQIYPSIKNSIVKEINKNIEKYKFRNKVGNVFYDVTNYYFEIDEEDNWRRLGKGKENTKTPIIQMGLLQDENAIPITYKLFPGNTPDYVTMLPTLSDLKKEYKLKNITIVADKGNNTSTNIALAHLKGDGFIFSQSIRGTKSSQDIKKWVIDDTDYQKISDDFKLKSKIDEKTIHIKKEDSKDGKAHNKKITVKYVAYWSKKYEVRSRHKRNKQISKALKIIDSKSQNIEANYYKAAKYIKDFDVNLKTGEVKNSQKIYELNKELIHQEEECDGFYCIVTNRTDLTDREIIDAYRGLWKIEETFKISKSDLNARPIFATSEEGIKSHFLICYISLVISRLMQLGVKKKYSVKSIVDNLKQCNGTYLERNLWIFGYRTDMVDELYDSVGLPKQPKSMKLSEIKGFLEKNLLDSKTHYIKY